MKIKMLESRKSEDGTRVLVAGAIYAVSQLFGKQQLQMGTAVEVMDAPSTPPQRGSGRSSRKRAAAQRP